jgi:hypothetical protein
MVRLGVPVAGPADGPALVMDIVGVPSNHAMKTRWGISKDVADEGSHAVAAVGCRGFGGCQGG